MGHREKKPFAPWADRDHPEAAPDDDARFKWGLEEKQATIADLRDRVGELDDHVDADSPMNPATIAENAAI